MADGTHSNSAIAMKLTFERHQRINRIYDIMKDHYGRSKHYPEDMPFPELVITSDPKYSVYGEFFVDEEMVDQDVLYIIINMYNCQTMRQVVSTLIHEYTHYLQDINWASYTDLDDDPYEIEANQIAKRDCSLFMGIL